MKSILIVDDIKVNLKVLEVLLTRNGYNTTSALSGKDALSLLQIKPIDLIISDILMPGMDGFQFCRLCKLDENLKHIPVIFYSSTHTESTAKKLAKKVGATAFITKPADPAMLLKTIDTILDGHGFSPCDHESLISEEPEDDSHPETAIDIEPAPTIEGPRDGQDLSLLKNIPCAVWTVDAGGKITYISPGVESITGFTVEYLLRTGKRQWLTRVSPDHVEKVRSAYKNLYQNNIPLDIEYRFQCRDAEIIWLHEKSGLPYTRKGIRYVDGISIDISEKKYIQAHGMKSREHQAIKTFSTGIAHDLNTLITGITGYMELSRMESTTPSEQQQFLSNAMELSTRASELAHQFYVLSSTHKPAKESTLLSDVVAGTTRNILSDSNVQLKLEIPPDLWVCRVEQGPMTQAMTNILLNAKQSLESSGFIEVILQNISIKEREFISDNVLQPGKYIKITIRDNGCGIEKKYLHRIFHPYFSTRPRETRQGQGLGLSISEAIISQHGGVMAVTSQRGTGTTMDIYLPTSPPGTNTADTGTPIPTHRTRKLLIMDTDEMVRDVTCQILERSGFKVVCVQSNSEVISSYRHAMLSNEPFCAVILDIMPHTDKITCLTTLKHLQKIHPGVRVIASSACPSDPIITQYKHHGFHGTLSKPYVAGDLVSAIKNLLCPQTEKS